MTSVSFVAGAKPKAPAAAASKIIEVVKPGIVHPVTKKKQVDTLKEILKRGKASVAAGKTPVLVLDLDLTTLLAYERINACLKKLGTNQNIEVLKTPEKLSMIPGYTELALPAYNTLTTFSATNPDFGAQVFSAVRNPYWNPPGMSGSDAWLTDEVSPGLVDFLAQWKKLGGEVAYASNRPGGENARQRSKATLEKNGIEVSDKELPLSPGGGDAQAKGEMMHIIVETFGTPTRPAVVVATVDDRYTNRDAETQALALLGQPDVMSVSVAGPRLSYTEDCGTNQWAICTFELAPQWADGFGAAREQIARQATKV